MYDNERANGTTYYYNPAQAKAKYCNVRKKAVQQCFEFSLASSGSRIRQGLPRKEERAHKSSLTKKSRAKSTEKLVFFVFETNVRLQPPIQRTLLRFQVVDFGVGIIRPDWLQDATYLGEEQCGIYQ